MKKLILMLALFSAVLGAEAQIATQNSNALDNVSIGVTAGLTTPLDFNSMFPLNTNVGIKLQKDFTPVVGAQVEGLAFLNDNHFTDVKTTVKATNVGVNGLLNLSNLFAGYKDTPRTFEVSTVTGIGWLHIWTTKKNYLTAKTGLDLAFNLGQTKANSIVLTPAVYWNLSKTKDVQFDKRFAQLGLNVTFVHHFKTSNGTNHFKTWDVGAMNDEINYLRGALDECEKRPAKEIVREVRVPRPIELTTVVEFELASSELLDEAKAKLDNLVNSWERTPNATLNVEVTATASPDGPEELNKELSDKRAQAVADYLTEKGVNVKSVEGLGVKLNRIATVKVVR